MRRNSECVSRLQPMPPAAKKTPAAPAPAADTAPVKNPAIAKPAPAPKVAPPAKNAALAAVAAAMAATAAGAAPQKAAAANPTIAVEDGSKPRRWIVKKTLNKFRANLRSVPDYYLPKFIQLIAAEVAPRCDGDQLLSRSTPPPPPPLNFVLTHHVRYLKFSGTSQKDDMILAASAAQVLRRCPFLFPRVNLTPCAAAPFCFRALTLLPAPLPLFVSAH
jgi:hypothetical protein